MIVVMGMVLFASTKLLRSDMRSARVMRARMFAKRYVEMGLEVGRHPGMEFDDPLLSHSGGRFKLLPHGAAPAHHGARVVGGDWSDLV